VRYGRISSSVRVFGSCFDGCGGGGACLGGVWVRGFVICAYGFDVGGFVAVGGWGFGSATAAADGTVDEEDEEDASFCNRCSRIWWGVNASIFCGVQVVQVVQLGEREERGEIER